jgi:hypothetical protein
VGLDLVRLSIARAALPGDVVEFEFGTPSRESRARSHRLRARGVLRAGIAGTDALEREPDDLALAIAQLHSSAHRRAQRVRDSQRWRARRGPRNSDRGADPAQAGLM